MHAKTVLWREKMLEVLGFILLIILSPIALIAGVFSLFIILVILYSIINIPIVVAKKLKEDKKRE